MEHLRAVAFARCIICARAHLRLPPSLPPPLRARGFARAHLCALDHLRAASICTLEHSHLRAGAFAL